LLLSLAGLPGCNGLVTSSFLGTGAYEFPGIGRLSNNGDGTYTVEWDKLPAAGVGAQYDLFVKEGSATDPTASAASFDFSGRPLLRTSENSFRTPNLMLRHNTCFAVRIVFENYLDTNTRQLCTGHNRFVFSGLSAATPSALGVTLSWPLIPAAGIQYQLFSSAQSGLYDWTKCS
jgi:hypothetical protein